MKQYIVLSALLGAFGFAAAGQADDAVSAQSKGFGAGAVVGGLLGGPVGAVVGAAGGAWLGHREEAHDAGVQRLASALAERERQLAELQQAFARDRQDAEEQLRRVKLDGRRSAAQQLGASLWLELHFATGEFALDGRALPPLERLAALLGNYPDLQVYLEGYADPRGDSRYNQRLSEARANTVKLHLIRAGLAPARIHTVGYGERRSQGAADAEQWLYDRRVTLRVGFGQRT